MSENNFEFSGHPTFLEWYKCYEDPSRNEWIDGMELKNHMEEWDAKQKAKWNFFHRPIPALVGRPQKKMINELRESIHKANKQLEISLSVEERKLAQARDDAEERLNQLQKTTQHAMIGAVFGFVVVLFIHIVLAIIPIGFGIFIIFNYQSEKSKISENLLDIEREAASRIKQMRDKHARETEKLNQDVNALRSEIDSLLKQIPKYPSAAEIEEWFNQEIRDMERKCLSEIVNDEVDEEKLNQLLRHEPSNDLVRGLLIQGWGLLQPAVITSPFGKENTGSVRVRQDIGAGIATWRVGTKKQPIYRVPYLQYVFLLKKNINVYGFFYDFVTRKWYGKRSETFQYNHVTNFSIREVQIEEEEWVKKLGLPTELTDSLFGKEINAFSLAVSNGAHFRCVLIDNTVVEGMNKWLKLEEEIRELKKGDDTNKGIETTFQKDQKLQEKWAGSDEDRNELLKHFVREKAIFEEQDLHIAKKVLQRVRENVERYA